jgi:hypothetical protein
MGFLKKISIFWIVVLAFLFFAGVMHIVDAIDGNKQPLLSTVLSATLALQTAFAETDRGRGEGIRTHCHRTC